MILRVIIIPENPEITGTSAGILSLAKGLVATPLGASNMIHHSFHQTPSPRHLGSVGEPGDMGVGVTVKAVERFLRTSWLEGKGFP